MQTIRTFALVLRSEEDHFFRVFVLHLVAFLS